MADGRGVASAIIENALDLSKPLKIMRKGKWILLEEKMPDITEETLDRLQKITQEQLKKENIQLKTQDFLALMEALNKKQAIISNSQKIQIVIFQCGYVESGTNWINMFITPELRSSVQEILESISRALINGRHDPEPLIYKDCCKAAKGSKESSTYCSKCGNRIGKEEFKLEDYSNMIYNYLSGVADGTYDAWENLKQEGWMCFGETIYQLNGEDRYPKIHPFEKDATYIYIYNYAEQLLAAAYMNKLFPKETMPKEFGHALKLENHVKIFGRNKENLKLFNDQPS